MARGRKILDTKTKAHGLKAKGWGGVGRGGEGGGGQING
jgi:hypothetical protein